MGGAPPKSRAYLFEVLHSERQVLQGQQDELQHGSVAGGLGVSEPRVEQPVASDSDEPGEKISC